MNKKILNSLILLSAISFCTSCGGESSSVSSASFNEISNSSESSSESNSSLNDSTSLKEKYNCTPINEALALLKEESNAETEEMYIYGIIKTVTNTTYGEMYIEDGTGELYVYGISGFSSLNDKPVKGDEIVLHGKLVYKKNNKEMSNSCVIAEFRHIKASVDENTYPLKTIKEARSLTEGSKVTIEGVVSKFTLADKLIKNGFYVSDGTSSMYVYSLDIASQVEIGNKIKIAGEKTYYIYEQEASNAKKFKYTGSNQIQNVILLENDKQVNTIDYSFAETKTIKEIMETPVSEDITNLFYKVNAYIKKSPGSGFINYYIDDFDGKTGSYVYTNNNGNDLNYLEPYDGKKCTLIMTAINAKSTATNCFYRFMPIEVLSDNYQFDETKVSDFVLDYYVSKQFKTSYDKSPNLEVFTSVSNEIIPFENVKVSYEVENSEIAKFETVDGKLYFDFLQEGVANIIVKAIYNNVEASRNIRVSYYKPVEVDTISVKDAIETEVNNNVIVRGIVGPSITNKVGFILIDETGAIPTLIETSEIMASLEFGDEVIISGTRSNYIKSNVTGIAGQDEIYEAKVLANFGGNHDYSTTSFVKDKSISDIISFAKEINVPHTTTAYTVKTTIKKVPSNYSTNYYLGREVDDYGVLLYSSSGSQYSFLDKYLDQEVEVELMLCNYNSKTKSYAGHLLSVKDQNGNKTYNLKGFSR